MADQKQHKDMNGVIEQEPLIGLNLISDATINANSAMKSNALTEVDPNSVSNFNVNASDNTNSKSTTDLKKVSIAEVNEEAGGINESHEVALPEGEDIEDRLADEIDGANVQMDVGEKKKKKSKKKKPKSQRGLNNPTGFEEYYVDHPITPAEYEEEKSIYDVSLPFAQRIEKAIQRFLARRNLDSTRKNLFTKYLIHGGIEAGPKMFTGGLDTETLETRNAAEIAELRATTFVDSNKNDIGMSDHVVDFEGCLGSFMSHTIPSQFELHSEEKIEYFVGIIRNFFNYLLHHDVCPDYKDQIYAARTLCDKAEKELWAISQCSPMLPGDVNKSCSEIFGGMYQGMWSDNQEWLQGRDIDYDIGISPQHARKVFKYALAVNADDNTLKTYRQQLEDKATKVVSVHENTGFEVTELIFATQDTLNFYAQPECVDLKPVGKMRAKTWIIPTSADDDLTEAEEVTLAAKVPETKYYEFWVEDEILSKCVVGMKLEATVTELSFGVSYFDALFGVHCSFYQLLPNELMAGWRTPEKEWLPMRKKTEAANDRDANFDDIPGEVGEENMVLNDGNASGEQLPENIENGINEAGDEPQGTNGNKGLATETDGNGSTDV
ncbi:MAG: hypothetical protein ASARMPREDX12_007814 [Alectoria sarmentosa]|nr:MAG: hypothetical protein ASARMPREDX12_007814 [Alectoria sarmentosa]